MPRKDPDTGCMVLTPMEFWAKEAEHEGKGREPWELMNEMFDELEADTERCRQRLLDPAVAFDIIHTNMVEINGVVAEEDQYHVWPTRVIRVIDATMHQSLRDTDESFTAVVETNEGRKLCRYSAWHDSGSYLQPPDGEANVEFEDLPFDGVTEDNGSRLLWLAVAALPVIGLILGLL